MTYGPFAASGEVRRLPLILFLIAPALAGCDDPFGPGPWNDQPIEVRLWSIDRTEHIGLPSAYDFFGRGDRVAVEDPRSETGWDVVVSDVEGGLAFVPAGAFPDITSDVGIAVITGVSFDELLEAPRDASLYITDRAVPLEEGGVYVVRTRRAVCDGFGNIAPKYAKVTVTEIDLEEGSVVFKVVRNPYCNNRSFVPPEDD